MILNLCYERSMFFILMSFSLSISLSNTVIYVYTLFFFCASIYCRNKGGEGRMAKKVKLFNFSQLLCVKIKQG